MHKPTTSDTGWVTFYRVRMPDGRKLLIQKNDGSTRTIPATSGARR